VTFALYIINWLVFITVVESVYSAVRTDSSYKADYVSALKVKYVLYFYIITFIIIIIIIIIITIIIYCNNNVSGKYWTVVSPKQFRPPKDPEYQGATVSPNPLDSLLS
jgi:hypothetical protein